MAEAEASDSVSAWLKWWRRWWRGGGRGARELGGDERVTAATAMASTAEEKGAAYATAAMSEKEIARAIETSRQQGVWSEVAQHGLGAAARRRGGGDAVLWEQLKRSDPVTFRDLGEGKLELGRMIAEGGQAQIYLASLDSDDEYVAKVFKMEGFSLAELQRHWPRMKSKLRTPLHPYHDTPVGLGRVIFANYVVYCSTIYVATFLKDGRFVFLMRRYWGDLRTLIDLRLKDNNSQGPPFSIHQAHKIMREIAMGIYELHGVGVLHKDLKAANILIDPYLRSHPRYDDKFTCLVADYESAMLVKGTGFWRAPEVLEELMKHSYERKVDIWTEKVDVYSYAITCYEVLTGYIPFSGYTKKDWKRVIDGERPQLPYYIDSSVLDLIEKCWNKDPSKRPNFLAIVKTI